MTRRDRNKPIPEPEYEKERNLRILRARGWDVDRAVREMRSHIHEDERGDKTLRL